MVEPFGGPAVIVVLGGCTSTVNVRAAGVASMLPERSTALAQKVWLPLLRFASVQGELQLTQTPLSTRHWNVDPDSLDVNEKVGVES